MSDYPRWMISFRLPFKDQFGNDWLYGSGDTPEEARANLDERLAEYTKDAQMKLDQWRAVEIPQ